MKLGGRVRVPVECRFQGTVDYKDAFMEIDVDVIVTDEEGKQWKVPAFYAGDREWGFRFAAPHEGTYTYQSVCTNAEDAGLNTQQGSIEITAYTGDNPLYVHGAVRPVAGGRYFEHEDGTPFLWLADTWWMILSKRIGYEDMKVLARDRAEKGFSVIQLVNGMWCDCGYLDPRCENEAGYCWKGDYETINPMFYEYADQKMAWIVKEGFLPCVLSCWGFYAEYLGIEKLKKHVRNMVARWGAYPLVWCVAGETCMQTYEHKQSLQQTERKSSALRALWTEVAKYIREIDPYNRTMTTHPMGGSTSLDELDDVAELEDFYTYQGGHGSDQTSISSVTKAMNQTLYHTEPVKPFINMESNYEAMCDYWGSADIQRYLYWNTMLDGAAGFSYGAQGIWNCSTEKEPFGNSMYGVNWGNIPWTTSYQLSGSHDVGVGKKILEKLPWWRLEPAKDLIQGPEWSSDGDFYKIVGAYIPGELYVIYKNMPNLMPAVMQEPDAFCPRVVMPKGEKYAVTFVSPRDGHEEELGYAQADESGKWIIKREPDVMQDWVIVLKRVE